MLGWARRQAVRASPRASSAVDALMPSSMSRTGMRFMATRRCRRVSQQVHTVPKPPVPLRASTR